MRRLPHAAEARQQSVGVAQSPLPALLQVRTAELNAAGGQGARSVNDACWLRHIAAAGQHRQHEHAPPEPEPDEPDALTSDALTARMRPLDSAANFALLVRCLFIRWGRCLFSQPLQRMTRAWCAPALLSRTTSTSSKSPLARQ